MEKQILGIKARAEKQMSEWNYPNEHYIEAQGSLMVCNELLEYIGGNSKLSLEREIVIESIETQISKYKEDMRSSDAIRLTYALDELKELTNDKTFADELTESNIAKTETDTGKIVDMPELKRADKVFDFVVRHKTDCYRAFKKSISHEGFKYSEGAELIKMAREEIGYSDKTWSGDIYNVLHNVYKSIVVDGKSEPKSEPNVNEEPTEVYKSTDGEGWKKVGEIRKTDNGYIDLQEQKPDSLLLYETKKKPEITGDVNKLPDLKYTTTSILESELTESEPVSPDKDKIIVEQLSVTVNEIKNKIDLLKLDGFGYLTYVQDIHELCNDIESELSELKLK
jgi:hypothetical protein